MAIGQVASRILEHFGWIRKMDHNEFARLFVEGGDLPQGYDYGHSPESAMRISAVYGCVTVRSQTLASLPLSLYERQKSGGVAEVTSHPVAQLLRSPNPYMSSFEWVQQGSACLDLRGNWVNIKQRDGGGRVISLLPVHPSRVTLEEREGRPYYRITDKNGRQQTFLADDVLHVANLTTEGYWGQSPIAAARDAIVMANKVQKYGIDVLESGGAKRILLRFPNAKSNEFIARLRELWRGRHGDNAGVAVLDDGGDATTIGMNADEAQYLETRQMTVIDIARIYTVPLTLLGVHDKTSSYASTEQFDLMFGKHTIRPLCKRIEARLDRSLLEGPDRQRFFTKFNLAAILRADIKTRTEALKIEFMYGKRTINDWLRLEDEAPVNEEWGDWHFVPANLIPIERLAQQPVNDAPPESGGVGGDDNEPQRNELSWRPLIEDVARRLVAAEVRGVRRERDFESFRTQHRKYAYRALLPLCEAAGLTDPEQEALSLANALSAGPQPGEEVDIANRENEIAGRLAVRLCNETLEMAGQVAALTRAQWLQSQAVGPSDSSPIDRAGM
jgi:HK97 family phage portal protein